MKRIIRNEMALVKAYLISLVLLILQDVTSPVPRELYYPVFVYYLLLVTGPLYCFICLRIIRGKAIVPKKSPCPEHEIGVWGYLWRTLIVFIVVFFLLVAIILGLGFDLDDYKNSHWAFRATVFTFITPLVIWGLFCKNRIEFLKKMILYLRGGVV